MNIHDSVQKGRRLVNSLSHTRGVFRPRQTRQLPRAVDFLSKLLITTTPFLSLLFLLLLLALQLPLGVVFYSPLVVFSLLACEVS